MLIYKEENSNYKWGIWKMEEAPELLLSQLNNKQDLVDFTQTVSSSARTFERIAVRVLLKTLLNEEKTINYHPNGKPYFEDQSINLSISHTKDYVAVILSQSPLVGIDIEYISDRVKRVRSRFISDLEYIDSENEIIHLLLHWSAKETMYKALSKEKIDLKNNFHIHSFAPQQQGSFKASETFTENNLQFQIQYIVTDDYVVTYTV
ncbi:4'-phosphopantetheinyl transferase family protein [Dysgonomonas sp. GY617]|uniref:4'-phosphopantetheinyl transferase family protein n=1 Tax=Dysgonomonas sp. GY617 TaxID=2780420 RepID=UPI001883B543|nr:4'-phosphopantetheinyl transferase family protein [Dysgonomonas sp. GY617]MBF0575699.1 4'-phosphopantetheinyl transferase superfamily protein [Dysgonomonas sp. GY617]